MQGGSILYSKPSKNEPVNMESMLEICDALGCDIGDIVDSIQGEGM